LKFKVIISFFSNRKISRKYPQKQNSVCIANSSNSRFTQLRSFSQPENLFSRRMFYLGRENSVRFHSQLREAATRYLQAELPRG